MGFDQTEVDELLASTGRHCGICRLQGGVQVHHIIRPEDGGTDDIENGIPLCPNCHDKVHAGYAPGRTTRSFTPRELRLHREKTIKWWESVGLSLAMDDVVQLGCETYRRTGRARRIKLLPTGRWSTIVLEGGDLLVAVIGKTVEINATGTTLRARSPVAEDVTPNFSKHWTTTIDRCEIEWDQQ